MKYELINDIIKIKISSLPFLTIEEFLECYIPSKKMKHLLFQNHWIFMDGTRIGRQSRLVGEYLEIKIYPNWSNCISQQQVQCEVEIVYEDAFLVIVYKPSGLIVHDDDSSRKNLQKILNDYYFQKGTGIAVQALHRLDRETTGLVAFSKSPVFQPLFDKMIAEKRIQRNYLAIVDRVVPKKKKYTFTDRIGQNRNDSAKRVITKSGIEAKTVAVSLGTYLNLSLLKCTLYTGRTHQIRLHLSFHGMPIINDCLYGQKSKFIEEMGLFGYELVFIHPITEIPIQLQCNFDCQLKEKMELFH